MYIKEINGISMSDVDRFWTFILKKDCWIWLGAISGPGYGVFRVNFNGQVKLYLAHRVSYWLHNKDCSSNFYVLHKCDNTLCVNPKHLFLGTNSDNVKDCVSKGRYVSWDKRGEKCPTSKLKENDVIKIRELYSKGIKQIDIAKMFNIKQATISQIVNFRTWKDVSIG